MPCDSPFWVLPKGHTEKVPVPCGRCPPCKKRRVDGWVFRLLQEQNQHDKAHFITLTYENWCVPLTDNGFMTLDKTAFPLFMKRLRKRLRVSAIKYFAVGEYGSKNMRPHYHAIVFGVDDEEEFYKAWSLDGRQLGVVHVGQVSGDSIAYCMKYIDKLGRIPLHDRDDRLPEFSLMSKGLGKSYVTDAVKRYHWQDYSRLHITRPDGVKIAMPRYYRNRIYDADDGGHQLRLIRAAVADAEQRNYSEYLRLCKDYSDGYTYDRFKEDQRFARYKRFYSSLKSRM